MEITRMNRIQDHQKTLIKRDRHVRPHNDNKYCIRPASWEGGAGTPDATVQEGSHH